MAKKKTVLVPIEKPSERRATYNKRKLCLLKKTEELSVLCGVDACIVTYGPDNGEPTMWPPREEALSLLTRFNNLPEAVRNKSMMNQKDFVSKQVEKLQVELRKIDEENSRLEAMFLLHDVLSGQCNIADVAGSGPVEMLKLQGAVEARLKEVRERMDEIRSVPRPVGPLEEVLLQGQCNFGMAGADVVPQKEKQYFSGLDNADVAPPRKKQRVFGDFGLGNADVEPQRGEKSGLPDWYPLLGSQEGECGPGNADIAPQGKEQRMPGLINVDMSPLLEECGPENDDVAPMGREQFMPGIINNDDMAPLLGEYVPENTDVVPQGKEQFMSGSVNADMAPLLEECGPKNADLAPLGKEQFMPGLLNADMAPLLGEPFVLPNWSPAGDSTEISDMAAVLWFPEAEDEIDQFFNWPFPGF